MGVDWLPEEVPYEVVEDIEAQCRMGGSLEDYKARKWRMGGDWEVLADRH